MRDRHSNKALLSPCEGLLTERGVGCGERRKVRRKREHVLSGLVGILSLFKFWCSVNTLCFLGVSDSVVSNVPLCFVYCSEGRNEAGPPCEWVLAMAGRSVSFPLLQRCASIFSSHRLDTTPLASQISAKHNGSPFLFLTFLPCALFFKTRNEFVKTHALNNMHFRSSHTLFHVLFVFSRCHVF